MRYDRITRILHWGFAIFVLLQIATGQLMEEEEDHHTAITVSSVFAHEGIPHASGKTPDEKENAMLEVHEASGIALALLVFMRVLWAFGPNPLASWRRLFPWIDPKGRGELLQDIRREIPLWLRGRLPDPSEKDTLAKTVHGVMFLLLLLMCATGLSLLLLHDGVEESEPLHALKEIHEFGANLLMVLVAGHVVMALWHQWLGHKVIDKMFLMRD